MLVKDHILHRYPAIAFTLLQEAAQTWEGDVCAGYDSLISSQLLHQGQAGRPGSLIVAVEINKIPFIYTTLLI